MKTAFYRMTGLPIAIVRRWQTVACYAASGFAQSLKSHNYLTAARIVALAFTLSFIVVFAELCRVFDQSEAGQQYNAALNNLNRKGE